MTGLRPVHGLALILGVAPTFRLGHQSFWYDELFTLFVARQPWPAVFEQAGKDGFTPPLYYLLVKLLLAIGIEDAALRLSSVAFGALFLVGLARLATRLGGERLATLAVLVTGLSPFFVAMAQELRPYTAFLACATFAVDGFLAWRAREASPRAWLVWSLLATLFSYLGFAIVAAGLAGAVSAPSPRRRGVALASMLIVVSALFAAPGLGKARFLLEARSARGQVALSGLGSTPFARLLLGGGYRPEPTSDSRDRSLGAVAEVFGGGLALAGLGLGVAARRKPLAGVAVALFAAIGCVFIADALFGIGVTTRYLSVAFVPFVLTAVLVAAAAGRAGLVLLLALLAVQGMALERYGFDPGYARDDWRSATARLAAMRREGDLVLGVPANHVAVALRQYAPGVEWLGGFVGRRGEPTYLYREGQSFRGYDFEGQLEEIGPDIAAALRRRIGARRVLLISYADDDWHGDTRPIVEAWGGAARAERFPARETLLIRELLP